MADTTEEMHALSMVGVQALTMVLDGEFDMLIVLPKKCPEITGETVGRHNFRMARAHDVLKHVVDNYAEWPDG